MSKKKFLLLFVGFVLTLLVSQISFAQENNSGLNITVSPSVLDLTMMPGDSVKQTFRIRNNTTTQTTYALKVTTLAPGENPGQVNPIENNNDPSLSWITFQSATVSAKPLEWTDVSFTLTVPKTAAFGYYYGIHISKANRENVSGKNPTKLVGEVLIPLLVNVKAPGAKAQLQFVSFSPTSFLNEYLPISFTLLLKNTGNVHLRPKGNLFIRTGPSDSDTAILDINPTVGAILPSGSRAFPATWNDGFIVKEVIKDEEGTVKKDSSGNPITKLTINWDKFTHFRIGKYTATAVVVYDNGTRDVPIEVKTDFWVFPYTIVGAAILALLLISIGIRFWLKFYIASQIKKYQKTQS